MKNITLAVEAGFEPTNDRFKVYRLTSWLLHTFLYFNTKKCFCQPLPFTMIFIKEPTA